MAAAIELASDVVAGGAALGGLFLVYIGGLTTSYGNFSREQQPHVRAKFQNKAWLAVVGLVAALLSAGMAVIGKWAANECIVAASAVLFTISVIWAIGVAILSAKEIR
jgi:hypothetical protein